jgi:hypothetical protein
MLVGGLIARSGFKPRFKWRLPFRKRALTPGAAARHYYDEMLHALQKRGLKKRDTETPLEFCESLRTETAPDYTDASTITQHFCRSFYGGKTLTRDQQEQTQAALDRLKHGNDHHAQRS